jgi:hypothetical protein
VDLERIADLPGQLLLAIVATRLFELFKPLLDLAMVGLQQRNRVFRTGRAAPAWPGTRLSIRLFHVEILLGSPM